MLKWRFSILSDADFAFDEDQRENMLDLLADKLNKTRAELGLLFSELQKY